MNNYITDKEVVKRARAAVRLAIEKKKAIGAPIIAYDSDKREIYQLEPNGKRTVLRKIDGKKNYCELYGEIKEA